MQEHAGKLAVREDSPSRFCLGGASWPEGKKSMSVAWVEIGKGYVSYHLMPVYVRPELLEGISERLKARMQGKSCFNFNTVDEALFKELTRLTRRGFAVFRRDGYIP